MKQKDCGCSIKVNWTRQGNARGISFCNLHAKASEMLRICERLVYLADGKLLSEKAAIVDEARTLLSAIDG